eukprot:CAMPEP_0172165838 /NCGR_PEP_ID=MMETSP1050-20130122/8637_1 /TAXON_ID=233186 /ORGANISM="Cryptomonas curvata, Strain CCAP979/52" /LENGTH=300 /DNA_ID=CAMNT_0012836359 /DNA_START=41 /DNA_END=939 /DNA_ORIENTATION=+
MRWQILIFFLLVWEFRPIVSAICTLYPAGSLFQEQFHTYSSNGLLDVRLIFQRDITDDGNVEYCFLTQDGVRSPVLHVNPGDELRITLTNAVSGGGAPATNMHFHGFHVSPASGQDEVVVTQVQPDGGVFTYSIAVPATHFPGVYWYHTHVHMAAEESVLGGASGMIVVEGLEATVPDLAGMPVRTLTLRDNLVPGLEEMHDTRGPSWDLSVNFVPVPYPDYPPVRAVLPPSAVELWRVVNACADSLLDLQLQYDGVPQDVRLVAMDGAPGTNAALQSILLPNGARRPPPLLSLSRSRSL